MQRDENSKPRRKNFRAISSEWAIDKNQSVIDYLSRSEKDDDGSREKSFKEQVRQQKERLLNFCREAKLETGWTALSEPLKSGGEHDVYLDSPERVTKSTKDNRFGNIVTDGAGSTRSATPLEYLVRINLQNKVFGDDAVFEAISDGSNLGFKLVISQTFIHGRYPTLREISAFMYSYGFRPLSRKLSNKIWLYTEEPIMIVVDAKEQNFIKGEKGITPIDLVMAELS